MTVYQTYGRHRQRIVSVATDLWGDDEKLKFSFTSESNSDTSSHGDKSAYSRSTRGRGKAIRGKVTRKAAKNKENIFDAAKSLRSRSQNDSSIDSSVSSGSSGIFGSTDRKPKRVLRDRSENISKVPKNTRSTKKPSANTRKPSANTTKPSANTRKKTTRSTNVSQKSDRCMRSSRIKAQTTTSKQAHRVNQGAESSLHKYEDSIETSRQNFSQFDSYELMLSSSPPINAKEPATPGIEVCGRDLQTATFHSTPQLSQQQKLKCRLYDKLRGHGTNNLSNLSNIHCSDSPDLHTSNKHLLIESIADCSNHLSALSIYTSAQSPILHQTSISENPIMQNSSVSQHQLSPVSVTAMSSLSESDASFVTANSRRLPDFSFVTGRRHKKDISGLRPNQKAWSTCTSSYDASKSLFDHSVAPSHVNQSCSSHEKSRYENESSIMSSDDLVLEEGEDGDGEEEEGEDVPSCDVTRYQLVESFSEQEELAEDELEDVDSSSEEDVDSEWESSQEEDVNSSEEESEYELSDVEEESDEEMCSSLRMAEDEGSHQSEEENNSPAQSDSNTERSSPLLTSKTHEHSESRNKQISPSLDKQLNKDKWLSSTPCHSRPVKQDSDLSCHSKTPTKVESPMCLTCSLIQQNTSTRTSYSNNTPSKSKSPERTSDANNMSVKGITNCKTPLNRLCHLNGVESRQSLQVLLTPVRHRPSGRLIPPRDKVLHSCDQTQPISFSECIPPVMMRKCKKIGEGVYGEVFRSQRHKKSVALKVIPIEGDLIVNDEQQKTFEEILPEIVISKELSALHDTEMFSTPNFVQVNGVSLVEGNFPDTLLKEWDTFHSKKGSENDRPDAYEADQLFLVFEFEDCGCDMESIKLTGLEQAKSILDQVTCSLAIAEQALQFEHRDLHWGNVLVRPESSDKLTYTLMGETFMLNTHGVKVAIIDFTLSRLSKEGCNIFTDLSTDPTLFEGRGDYQFDIYRLMKDKNSNQWEEFEGYTNVLWIHYLADKLLHCKKYGKASGKDHQAAARRFRTFLRTATNYTSALHLLTDCPFFDGVMLAKS